MLRDHAVPLQQARPRSVLPEGRGPAGNDRQRDVLPAGTLYPLVARATYPTLGFPQYPGEVGPSDADPELKARAQKDAAAAIAEPLDVYRVFFLDGRQFIGRRHPSIADIRLAVTLEFLRAIDYAFPAWATHYLGAVETALGEAYSEPAADVRGYIAHVKPQKA